MLRALSLTIFISGCATHYQLEVATAEPHRLPPDVHQLDASACPSSRWHTTYDWRARAKEPREPGTAVRIRSRCVEPDAAEEPGRGRVQLDGDAKLELTGSVGDAPPEPRMLEAFTFEDANGIVDIRDAGGRTRTIDRVERIEYYRNAVIIRGADGSGSIVGPESLLGVRWKGAAPK